MESFWLNIWTGAHCAKLNDTGDPAKKKLNEVVAPERMTPDEITIWDHESKKSESIFSKLPSPLPEPQSLGEKRDD